jgi:hypothetical protein
MTVILDTLHYQSTKKLGYSAMLVKDSGIGMASRLGHFQ